MCRAIWLYVVSRLLRSGVSGEVRKGTTYNWVRGKNGLGWEVE